MKHKIKTFQEWSDLGYQIVKGSKATWVDGKPMFKENQVVKYKKRTSYNKPYNPYNGRISRCDFAIGFDHEECADFPYDGF